MLPVCWIPIFLPLGEHCSACSVRCPPVCELFMAQHSEEGVFLTHRLGSWAAWLSFHLHFPTLSVRNTSGRSCLSSRVRCRLKKAPQFRWMARSPGFLCPGQWWRCQSCSLRQFCNNKPVSKGEYWREELVFKEQDYILLVRVLCTVRSVRPIFDPTRMKTKAGFPFFFFFCLLWQSGLFWAGRGINS